MAAFDASSEPTTRRVPRGGLLSALTLRVPRRAPETPPAATPDDATLRVGERAAQVPALAPDGAPMLPLGSLQSGALICEDCTVRATIRPHETTRPGLFDCQAPEGRVMVKIAAALHPPRPELWEKLPALRHPALVQTHRVAREQDFPCEIQEFCEGGTLDGALPGPGRAPLDWETIERGIVAPFAGGLAYLHRNGIVHRDVKPKNLYLRKRGGKVSLVIGDFDISSLIEDDLTSRDTVRAAGTHFYMAPEAFPRFVDADVGRAAAVVTPASDWYSFGVVLVELLQGTTSLHAGRWSDVYDFYMAGGRIEVPLDVPARARELMQGLLIRNRRTRWGAPEVERWLRGTTTESDRQRVRDDAGFDLVRRSARPYNVFQTPPHDLSSLGRAMMEEPGVAEEELMSGDVLINWIGELDMKVAREIRRDRERWRRFPRVAAFHALMRLDPTLPFPLGPGMSVPSIGEWEGCVTQWVKSGRTTLSKIVSRSTLLNLEAWLRGQSDPRPDLADAVAIMRAYWWPHEREGAILNALDARVAWEEMLYILHPTRPFHVCNGVAASTPAGIAQACWGTAAGWQTGVPSAYRSGLDRWQQGWLGAWLRQRLRDENGQVSPVVWQIEAMRPREPHGVEAAFEIVLRMLDPFAPPLQMELTGGEPPTILAEFGAMETRVLNWRALGAGLPLGAWQIEDAPAGLRIGPLEVEARSGELRVTFETLVGLQPGAAGIAKLSLAPGGTCALAAPILLRYRVRPPDSRRRVLVRNGALIGAGLAGTTRLVMFGLTGREWNPTPATVAPVTPPVTNLPVEGAPVGAPAVPPAPDVAEVTVNPPASYLGAGFALILGAAIGFYVWIGALRKFGRT